MKSRPAPGAKTICACTLSSTRGSTGHWPVPPGDPPGGTSKASPSKGGSKSDEARPALPVGGSPTGTGGSPVPPICTLNSTVATAMVLLLAAATGLAAGRNPNPQVLPVGLALHGRTYGDWAAAWWTWALQFPLEQNPITDPTGAYGSTGQKGPVWFLAGTFDGSAERSITVPKGKRIFFPLYNVFNDYSCPDPDNQPAPGQTLEEFLMAGAEAISDMATELFAEVDGVPIQNLWDYRAHSDMEMFAKHPSLLAFDPCLTDGPQPAVAAGYWLMLAPLAKGQHTIRFGSTARFEDFEFAVRVTYHLTVE